MKCHDDFDADDIVVEVNFGVDMATEVIKQAAERIHQRGERDYNMIRVKEVSASRGKVMRAEPISLLYEKGRVLHRRGLDQLEGETMAFSREWDRVARLALSAAKTRGIKLGNPKQAEINRARAASRLKPCVPHIERCIEAGRTSSSAIAADLNARGVAAPNGGQWFPMQVRRVRDRLGL